MNPAPASEGRRTSPRKRGKSSARVPSTNKKTKTSTGAKANPSPVAATDTISLSDKTVPATSDTPPPDGNGLATIMRSTTPVSSVHQAAAPTQGNPAADPQQRVFHPLEYRPLPAFGGHYSHITPYGQQPMYSLPHPHATSVQGHYPNTGTHAFQTTPMYNDYSQLYMAQYQARMAQHGSSFGAMANTGQPDSSSGFNNPIPPATTSPGGQAPNSSVFPNAFDVNFSLLLKEPTAPAAPAPSSAPAAPAPLSAEQRVTPPSPHAINPANHDSDFQAPADIAEPQVIPGAPDNGDDQPVETQPSPAPVIADSDDDYEEDGEGDIVPRIKGRHVSSINNPYGNVEGVGRGIEEWVVARTLKMGPKFTEQRDATRAHNAMLRTVISRAEHLSTRTGSWLYIAAQHPGSNNSFIHFASQKLRKSPEELDKIHQQAARTMKALQDGSRKEVTRLSAQVMEKDVEIAALTKKLEDAEASLAVQATDLAQIGRAIALVRAGDPRTLALLAEFSGSVADGA